VNLVVVHWLDSRQPVSQWMRADDLPEFSAVPIQSVGWLLRQDEAMTVLAANLGDVDSDEQQVSGIMQIPTCCVTSVSDLSPAPITGYSPPALPHTHPQPPPA
jgi:hypothetical protein